MSARNKLAALLVAFAPVFGACGDDSPSKPTDTSTPDGEVSDTSGDTTNPDTSDTSGPDGTDTSDTAAPPDTNVTDTNVTDTTGDTGPDSEIVEPQGCDEPLPAVADGVCSVSGDGDALLIRGDIVLPEGILERGSVLIENGVITCSGCDCMDRPAAAGATTFICPNGLVSPGLINAHDHIGYSQGKPAQLTTVRYDHRNEWRSSGGVTVPGKPKIPGPQNDDDLGDSLSELRHVLGGVTSYFGSGGAPGLARNLDVGSRLEGLSHKTATYDTFPLGSSGVSNSGCGSYDMGDLNPSLLNAAAWVPHVAEGVNVGARNEQLCLDGTQAGSVDLVADNTGFIHGVGTTAADIALFTGEGAALVWSPRTNTALYGFTAFAPIFHRLGGQVALGSDWIYTGSMNMLRELRCAEEWNARWDNYFSERELIAMVTSWGAAALGFDDILGSLTVGKVADIAIWDARVNEGYRAILDAEVPDVALVMRGGTPLTIDGTTYFRRGRPLFGDANLVDALSDRELDYNKYDPNIYHPTAAGKKRLEACEALDVCGSPKKLCLAEQLEAKPNGSQFFTTTTYAELMATLDPAKTYQAFACGEPPGEPTCVPSRPNEFTGVPSGSDDDGDGVLSGEDNCPGWFNAIRPMDGGKQPDTDGDGEGDVCDPCPFDADTTACSSVNPDDIDQDGFLNASDNCPSDKNPGQEDGDEDGIGDACDACPAFSNLGGKPCPSTITAVKKGEVASGEAVFLPGVVATVIGPDFYTVQIPGPAQDYGALYVFTGASGAKPTAGQLLDLQGTVNWRFGQIQMVDATFTVLPTPGTVPAPMVVVPADVIPGGAKEKAVEGMLVEVRNVAVTNISPTPQVDGTSTENVAGEFIVTGDLRVDDGIYLVTPPVVVGQQIGVLRGVLRYSWNRNKLLPRSAADITYGAPQLLGFSTGSVTIYSGATAEVTVVLTSEATEATTVTLSSDNAAATVPASLVFAIGEKTKAFTITGVSAGVATIKAKLGDVEKTLAVTVVDAATDPKVVALEADPTSVLLGETTTLTVTLDLPAKAGGTPVAISTAGVAVTAPTEVIVPAGSTSVDFEVDVGAVQGTATITASAGGGEASVELEVIEGQLVGLLIVEVFYNAASHPENPNANGGDDKLEWVKLYNGSGASVDLSQYSLAWGGQKYGGTDGLAKLQLVGTMPAGACFIVGGPLTNGANGSPSLGQATDLNPDIQNSGTTADAVGLFRQKANVAIDTANLVDTVVYGVNNTDGFVAPGGAVAPVSVADSGSGKSVRRVTKGTWEINPTPNAVPCVIITQ